MFSKETTDLQNEKDDEKTLEELYRRFYRASKLLELDRYRDSLLYRWDRHARANQRVPKGQWRAWLILAGRGFGKTRTGAETLRQWVEAGQTHRIALIGDTESEVRDVMIEGESGLLAVHPPESRPAYEPSKRRVTWPNGAIATVFSAENYEQLRGPQFDCAWIDELCKFKKAEKVWDQLNFALRLGKHPRVILTTTPRPTPLLKELLQGEKKGDVYVTRGTTFENIRNLSPSFIHFMRSKYLGTTLGEQELKGRVLDQVEGALWSHELLSNASMRRNDMPDLIRIVVSVDPAITSHGKSDETGIIVAGTDPENRGYVLDDLSGRYSPSQWAKVAVEAYHRYRADSIVAEVNQGGDMVETIIRSIENTIPFRGVHATRGKMLRAEPVVSLYEQGRIYHRKGEHLKKLEQQMLDYAPGISAKSPDRLDALVWAITELLLPKDLRIKPRIIGFE